MMLRSPPYLAVSSPDTMSLVDDDDIGRALAGAPPLSEEEKGGKIDRRRRLIEFFESGDLYRAYLVPGTEPRHRASMQGAWTEITDQIEVPKDLRIEVPCPTCEGSTRTFAFHSELPGRRELIELRVDESSMLLFGCTHCLKQHVAYLVHLGRTGETQCLHLVKAGVWPSARPVPSRELAKGLGPAAELFNKGLIAKKFGFGIGAFAYYRRVAEDIIGRLLDSLRTYAEDVGETELIKAIDATAAETQASKRIEVVKDLLPKLLRPGGMNPLGTLYEALSGGLHAGTDEECLDRAEALRVAIEFLVTRLDALVTTPKQYVAAMEKLKAKQAPKGSKPSK